MCREWAPLPSSCGSLVPSAKLSGISGLPALSKHRHHTEAALPQTTAVHLTLRKCGRFSGTCKWKTESFQSCTSPGKHPLPMSSIPARREAHRKALQDWARIGIGCFCSNQPSAPNSSLLTCRRGHRCPLKSSLKPPGIPRICAATLQNHGLGSQPVLLVPTSQPRSPGPPLLAGSLRSCAHKTGCHLEPAHPTQACLLISRTISQVPHLPGGETWTTPNPGGKEAQYIQGVVYMPEFQRPSPRDVCEN